MLWGEFATRCPEIAGPAEDRCKRDQLLLLGTLRKDGSPRISPCEVDIAAGHLFLGMMWRSPKAVDLLRDPRIVVHTVTCDKDAPEADIKLYGGVIEVTEQGLRQAFRDAITARIKWAPEEPHFHLFSLDVRQAASVVFKEGGETVTAWDPARGLRQWTKQG